MKKMKAGTRNRESHEIANIFANQLSTTFNEEINNNFDNNFKLEIINKVNDYTNLESPLNDNLPTLELVNLKLLNKTIQKLKSSNGCGLDNISNTLIKHLPKNIKLAIIHLFNLIFSQQKIPETWRFSHNDSKKTR